MALKSLAEFFGERSDLTTKMTPVEEKVAEKLSLFKVRITSLARANGLEKIEAGATFAYEMAESLLDVSEKYKKFRGEGKNSTSDAMHMVALANVSHNLLSELEKNVGDFLNKPFTEELRNGITTAKAANSQVLLRAFKALPTHTPEMIQSELTEKGYIVQDDFASVLTGMQIARASVDMQGGGFTPQ